MLPNKQASIPIPREQRPINEYQELCDSFFFRWATIEPRRYIIGLVAVWSGAWLIAGPVAAFSFEPTTSPFLFFLAGAAGAGLALSLVMARLYLGWFHVYDRLVSARVSYEETGGHDGSYWKKPAEELAKDRLLVQYRVFPVIQRLRRTLAVVAFLGCFDAVAWWWLL
jgi:Conserved in the green lineage and diatoms 27